MGGVYLGFVSLASTIGISLGSILTSLYWVYLAWEQKTTKPEVANWYVAKAIRYSSTFYMSLPAVLVIVIIFFIEYPIFRGHPSYVEKAVFIVWYSGVLNFWTDILCGFQTSRMFSLPKRQRVYLI